MLERPGPGALAVGQGAASPECRLYNSSSSAQGAHHQPRLIVDKLLTILLFFLPLTVQVQQVEHKHADFDAH